MFEALGQTKRREMVQIIAKNGTMTATQISRHFKVTPQAISQHLKLLCQANVLSMQRVAQMRLYSVNPKSVGEFNKWSNEVLQLWDNRLDRLDKIIEREKKKTGEKTNGN